LEGILDANSTLTVKSEEAKEELTRVEIEGKFEVENSKDGIVIKEEPDIESRPRQTEQEQALRTLGRQYRMRIKLEQGAMKENSSKGIMNTILDSRLSLNVAPLVGTAADEPVFD
jgi:hypothetical protein